jgi:hypothetical protein
MQSINDLSCNDQLATSAGCRALERKMIDDLMAKVNSIPDKATPIDATVSRAFELALAGFNSSPARLKLPAPAYLLTEVAEDLPRLNPLYLARSLNALSIKTVSYLRGIFQRVVDSMTFKTLNALDLPKKHAMNYGNTFKELRGINNAAQTKEKPSTTL